MKLIDNQTILLGDDLKREIKSGSKLRIAASCFSIYAFNELKRELEGIEELRFIFSSSAFVEGEIAEKFKKEKREFFLPNEVSENSIYGTEFEVRLRNKLSQRAIARECADWIRAKAKFKSNISGGALQPHIAVDDTLYHGVNGFTVPDLGYEKDDALMRSVIKLDGADGATTRDVFKRFDEIWDDKEKLADITDKIVEHISSAYNENSPEFLYYIILYNIFTEFLDDLNEDAMPNEATGFKNTKLWRMLFDFQKDGVISIINKLEKHNGCILADSVGLGKTFTALAVILYYSLRNKSILVLCPKRLGENWTQYSGSVNDTTNVFYEDRIRYEVLFHTDLGRGGTAHSGRNLATVNWGNYDLVVIDESHNFRNNNPVKDKETRYDFLINHVIRAGVKTKVLMLSATPVNNRYNDLKNQLALAYAQDYEGFEKSLSTTSNIQTIFSRAQAVFNEWSKKPASERKTKDLIDSLSIDFKILLDSVTIARSRKNIVKYYNTGAIGKFPDRLPPRSLMPELTKRTDVPQYKEIYKSIKSLSLAVYGLFDFVLDSQVQKYERRFSVDFKTSTMTLSRQNKGLKKLMAVNLLKRLESSVEAFRLTMRGILDLNLDEIRTLDRFDDGTLYPHAAATRKVFEYELFDADEDGGLNLAKTSKGTEVKVDYADIDRRSWKAQMMADVDILQRLLAELDKITPEHDLKLQTLKDIIDEKIKNPVNDGNKKVLIFSAFADTANYIYEHIAKWVKDKHGLESAMVEGQQNKTTLKHHPKRTNDILTMFSPISKDRETAFAYMKRWKEMFADPSYKISHKIDKRGYDDSFKDIDILIATDCISEGQNLQDCDICINYDIHWNPVRIVQRFGRIDRLKSRNKVVGLINFFPAIELNEYINLTDRVKSRMTIVDQTATADDNVLNPDDQMDDYREVQIKKLQEGENIDLEDANNGISISDLGLNEFRMDAVEFKKIYGKQTKSPKGMHAVIEKDESRGIVSGVIFVLKNYNKSVNIKNQNLLHPYYLVYLSDKGEIVQTHLQVKQILDAVRVASKGRTEPIEAAYRPFNKETADGYKMDKYSKLLEKAVDSIIGVKAEKDIDSLFTAGGTTALTGDIKGLDDFELICFVVVR